MEHARQFYINGEWVDPISTDAYPTPARRPQRVEFDLVDSRAILGAAAAPDWRPALRAAVAEALRNAEGG